MHAILDCLESKLITLSVLEAAFDATSGHPHRETVVIVISSQLGVRGVRTRGRKLDGGRPPKFTAPNDESIFEKSPLLQIHEQGRDWLVGFFPEFSVVLGDFRVAVPGLTSAMPDLDEADASLNESTGNQHLSSVEIFSVEFPDVFWFSFDIEGIGCLDLHLVGEFE